MNIFFPFFHNKPTFFSRKCCVFPRVIASLPVKPCFIPTSVNTATRPCLFLRPHRPHVQCVPQTRLLLSTLHLYPSPVMTILVRHLVTWVDLPQSDLNLKTGASKRKVWFFCPPCNFQQLQLLLLPSKNLVRPLFLQAHILHSPEKKIGRKIGT